MQYLGKRPQRSGNEGVAEERKYTAALRWARCSASVKAQLTADMCQAGREGDDTRTCGRNVTRQP